MFKSFLPPRAGLSPLSLAQHGKAGETGGFHGYWMHEPSQLDPHWGDEQDLVTLRRELDARGMSLVLDMVTNHVAYESRLPEQRPSWFHGQGNIEEGEIGLGSAVPGTRCAWQ